MIEELLDSIGFEERLSPDMRGALKLKRRADAYYRYRRCYMNWVCPQCRCAKVYPGDGENVHESRIFGKMLRRTICQDCYDIMNKNPHGIHMVKCESCGSIQKKGAQCSICGRSPSL